MNPPPLTPRQLDEYDKATTRAWQNGETFSRALAEIDARVDAHEGVRRTPQQRAARWKWPLPDVMDLMARRANHTGSATAAAAR